MPLFIPEWPSVSGRNLQLRRVLDTLDAACTVRRPVLATGWVPEVFVQHAEQGWLAIALCETPFAELDADQLIEAAGRDAFETMLGRFGALDGLDATANRQLVKLMLMWSCSPEETRALSRRYLARFGIRLLSRAQFLQVGEKLLPRLLAPLAAEDEQALLGRYFPEAEIPAVCTTRRYFLDVEQEWLAKVDLESTQELPQEQADAARDFSLRLVNGVAGSGKTLIALNRARMLAQLFPAQRILLLIHNTPIVADIKARLHAAYGGVPDNLEIITFSAWVARQWNRLFGKWPSMPERPGHVAELVNRYRAQWPDLKPSDSQLADEFDFINASLIAGEAQYQAANRAGQGFALRAGERAMVWPLYEAVTAALARSHLRMWSALPRDICLLKDQRRLERYHHILVDEAQFFAPSWFQVVKLALENQSQLFLCADPNQGFMKSRLSWKSVGLEVAGRTRKLRKSYRTTRAILQAASRLLAQATRGDPDDYLEPDFADMQAGTPPLLIYADSPQDALDRLVNEVAAASQTPLPLASLLVIYGDKVDKSLLVRELGERFGEERIWWLNRKEHKKLPPHGYGPDYLRVAYLETATGLEASVVFLVGLENLLAQGALPDVSLEAQAQLQEEHARKLYMAMTRAGQRLILVASERLPEAIEAVFVPAGRDARRIFG